MRPSAASPARWPCSSLYALKWSRSKRTSAKRQRAQPVPLVEQPGDRLVERQPVADAGQRVAAGDLVELAIQLGDVRLLPLCVAAQAAQRELLLEHRPRPCPATADGRSGSSPRP